MWYFFKTCLSDCEIFARALLKGTAMGLGEADFIAKLESVKAKVKKENDSGKETKPFEDLLSDRDFIDALRKRSLDEVENIESLASFHGSTL